MARWADQNSACPHCSSNFGRRVQVKGFDEMLLLASVMHEHDQPGEVPPPPPHPSFSDSDSDFELPGFEVAPKFLFLVTCSL